MYFHTTVREKNKKIGIYKLEDAHGGALTEFKAIEGEVIRFYKDLVGTTEQDIKHVDIIVIRDGAQLQETQEIFLFNQSLITKFGMLSKALEIQKLRKLMCTTRSSLGNLGCDQKSCQRGNVCVLST